MQGKKGVTQIFGGCFLVGVSISISNFLGREGLYIYIHRYIYKYTYINIHVYIFVYITYKWTSKKMFQERLTKSLWIEFREIFMIGWAGNLLKPLKTNGWNLKNHSKMKTNVMFHPPPFLGFHVSFFSEGVSLDQFLRCQPIPPQFSELDWV